jgi:hypothetical protein
MTKLETTIAIAAAIDRTKLEGRCVDVEISGNRGDVLESIRKLVDCEIGHTMQDRKYADGSYKDLMNVWGYYPGVTPAGEVAWRLAIIFTAKWIYPTP